MMIAANRNSDDDENGEQHKPAESHSQSPQELQPTPEKSGKGGLLEPTRKGIGEINAAVRRGFKLSRRLRAKAVRTVDECLDSHDEAIKLGAARAVIQMEGVNVAADKEPDKHLHIHGQQQNIQVVFSDDWYGSKAANAAATDGASAIGSDGG